MEAVYLLPRAAQEGVSIASSTLGLSPPCLRPAHQKYFKSVPTVQPPFLHHPRWRKACVVNPLQGDSKGPLCDLHVGQTGCRSSSLGVSGRSSLSEVKLSRPRGHEPRNCRNLGSRTEHATLPHPPPTPAPTQVPKRCNILSQFLFIWLHRILAVALLIFDLHCYMQDLYLRYTNS